LISLGSIFRSTAAPTPTPATVADIARLEADANANPHDLDKQIALMTALMDTRHKAGYETVVNRWERMTDFVCSGHSAIVYQG
jgi:ATP-dependent metalloprotease